MKASKFSEAQIAFVLKQAEGNASFAEVCRKAGISRSGFYRWRDAYAKNGEAGLINRPSIPKQHYKRTPVEIEEKVLHLRLKYHLEPVRAKYRCNGLGNLEMRQRTG